MIVLEHWVEHYQARGFNVLTPGYPGIEPGTAGVAALGGTFAQMLLDAGLGSAGVSIDGAGVKGVNALAVHLRRQRPHSAAQRPTREL